MRFCLLSYFIHYSVVVQPAERSAAGAANISPVNISSISGEVQGLSHSIMIIINLNIYSLHCLGTLADRCHADFHSKFRFYVPLSVFLTAACSPCASQERTSEVCSPIQSLLYTRWERTGDPSLLPRPRKTAYEATIVHHSLLRERDRTRDRCRRLYRPRRCCWELTS